MYTLTANTKPELVTTVEAIKALDWEVPTDADTDTMWETRDSMQETLDVLLKDFQGYNGVVLADEALDYFVLTAAAYYA